MATDLGGLVRDGDFEGALRAARALWTACHDPALVGLMDRLAAHVGRPPVAKQGRESHGAAWGRRCADDDPADVDVLLDDLFGRHNPGCDAGAVRQLLARTPDPRVATRLAAFLEGRGVSSSNRAFWMAGIDLVAKTGEPTSLAALERWRERHAGRSKPWGQSVARHLNGVVPVVHVAAPVPGIAELAGRIAGPRAEARDVAGLWAEVWADPQNLAVRAVLADRLQEDGDPRGQWMALQLGRGATGTPTREERALLKQWERTWLGAIEPVVLRQGTVWETGVLVACRYGNRPARGEERTADEWRTVRELDVAPQIWMPGAFDLLDHAPFDSLEVVWGVPAYHLDGLKERSWRSLGLRSYPAQVEQLVGGAAVLDGLPNLELLCVEQMEGLDHGHIRRLLADRHVQRLATLRVSASLVEGLAHHVRPDAPVLEVRTDPWDIRLQGGADGVEAVVRSRGNRRGAPQQTLERALRRVGPLVRVTIADTGPVALDREALETVLSELGVALTG
ncbi:MAG: hypothetical protein R3F61_24870 [Myxococcota bacterium]